MNWYFAVLQKYFDFNGRARRKEYWFFVLFNIAFSVALGMADNILGTTGAQAGTGLLSGIYALAMVMPGLALSARRLHDIGRSGWWMLINLVPVVGIFVFLYFMVKEGDAGSNQYGPSPKADMQLVAA
ncbi:MAG: DUF805 domain-containing protein [Caldilineaceae bacterium]